MASHCSWCYQKLTRNLVCSKCKSARYCDVDCQRHHWPRHKSVCHSPKVLDKKPDIEKCDNKSKMGMVTCTVDDNFNIKVFNSKGDSRVPDEILERVKLPVVIYKLLIDEYRLLLKLTANFDDFKNGMKQKLCNSDLIQLSKIIEASGKSSQDRRTSLELITDKLNRHYELMYSDLTSNKFNDGYIERALEHYRFILTDLYKNITGLPMEYLF